MSDPLQRYVAYQLLGKRFFMNHSYRVFLAINQNISDAHWRGKNKSYSECNLLLIHCLEIFLDFLDNQSWGERLTQLSGLLSVLDNKGVQVARASDLELGVISILLDASGWIYKHINDSFYEHTLVNDCKTYTWRPFCG
jgi:hypothetical protein